MPRDDRLLVRFHAGYLDPAVRDRLWRELIDFAIDDLGADSFSAQMDLLDESLPTQARQARESLLTHIRFQQPRRSFLGLRPPRWPLDPSTKRWVEQAGPWIYRLIIWKDDRWVLESATWGNHLTAVLRPEEWPRLQTERPWTAALEPAPKVGPFRKEDEHVRRGWSLSRPMRWITALGAAMAVGIGVALDQGIAGIWAGLAAGAVVYLQLSGWDPGPFERFIARARFPTTPGFDRRLERTLGLAVVGTVLVAFAIPFALVIADPGSRWRLVFWGVAVAGGLVALSATGVTVWWTVKYRRKEPR
jgi:hypothetical protein